MRKSQQVQILYALERKEWVTVPEMMRMGIANFTARISELRGMGYTVTNDKYWSKKDKRFHSRYTLENY